MKPYYLGIDVSKGYADFTILDANKKCVMQNFQMDDSHVGHAKLHEKLKIFFKGYPDANLFAAVESTGGYENNWFNFLTKLHCSMKIETARLNPLGVHANSKAGLNRNVTDKISARNIAEYMIGHSEKISYQKQDYFASARKQWSFIKLLTRQQTQLLNQFEKLLYSSHTQLIRHCKHGVPMWILNLVKRYPTAVALSRARKAAVAKINNISKERAAELIADAKKSVACFDDDIIREIITDTANQILQLKQTIKKQEKRLADNCSLPEVELLQTFPGIRTSSAVGLVIEIQAVARFKSSKKLASFFGVHPAIRTSGDGSKQVKMSKQGRKEPRHVLFMIAMSATQCNPVIKEIYEKHQEKGMCKMAAMGACMHKILRIVYGMLKNNTAFDPEIDRRNRARSLAAKEKNSDIRDKKQCRDYDPGAPISRRQGKKRKERKLSQSVNNAKNGINAPAPKSIVSAPVIKHKSGKDAVLRVQTVPVSIQSIISSR